MYYVKDPQTFPTRGLRVSQTTSLVPPASTHHSFTSPSLNWTLTFHAAPVSFTTPLELYTDSGRGGGAVLNFENYNSRVTSLLSDLTNQC